MSWLFCLRLGLLPYKKTVAKTKQIYAACGAYHVLYDLHWADSVKALLQNIMLLDDESGDDGLELSH